jgi:hypothetical protein
VVGFDSLKKEIAVAKNVMPIQEIVIEN